MDSSSLKVDIEKVVLIIAFGLFLYLALGPTLDYRISHPHPYGIRASDAFQDIIWVEGVMLSGSYKYIMPGYAMGRTDAVPWYAPTMVQDAAFLAFFAGLTSYDAVFITVALMAVLAALVMYVIVRRLSVHVAFIALPFMTFLFYGNFVVAFTWGIWGYASTAVFLVACFWAVERLDLSRSYLLLGLFLAALILGHLPESFIFFIYVVCFLALELLQKKLQLKHIKVIFISGIIALVLASYYLIILMNTGFVISTAELFIDPSHPHLSQGGFPNPTFSEFGLPVQLVLAAGFIVSLFYLSKMPPAILVSWFMFVIGYINYLGGTFGVRAFENRQFWPVYLSTLFGLGLYHILRSVVKAWNSFYSLALSIVLAYLLVSAHYHPETTPGAMNPYVWDAFIWARANTPENATLYFLFGDTYLHYGSMGLANRRFFIARPEAYAAAAMNMSIYRTYPSRTADAGIFYRTGPFTFVNYAMEITGEYEGNKDICTFDYYFIDKVSYASPPLAQYNMMIRDRLLKSGFMTEVYQNQWVSVLENHNKGGDCIGA